MTTLVPRDFQASLAARSGLPQDIALGSHSQDLMDAARESGEKVIDGIFARYRRPEEAEDRVKGNRHRDDASITGMSWRQLLESASRPTFPGECSCRILVQLSTARRGAGTPDIPGVMLRPT